MSSGENHEISEIPDNNPEIQENIIEDIAPVVPKRGRGRPKGAKNKVKVVTVDTDIPSVTLDEEPITLNEEPATPVKKPRVTRKKRAQPPPPDPTPERHVPEHVHAESGTTVHPMAQMMMSLHELQKQRMATKRAMYRNMIA